MHGKFTTRLLKRFTLHTYLTYLSMGSSRITLSPKMIICTHKAQTYYFNLLIFSIIQIVIEVACKIVSGFRHLNTNRARRIKGTRPGICTFSSIKLKYKLNCPASSGKKGVKNTEIMNWMGFILY